LAQHELGGVAILHVGGRNRQSQQPTVGVAEQMPLAALEFLVGIVTAGTSLPGGFYRLAVEDRRRGSGFFLGGGGRLPAGALPSNPTVPAVSTDAGSRTPCPTQAGRGAVLAKRNRCAARIKSR
jgi:hypothetical protein